MDQLQSFAEPMVDKDKETGAVPPAPDGKEEAAAPVASVPGQSGAASEKAEAPEAAAEKPNRMELDKASLLEAFGGMDAALRETSRQFEAFMTHQEELLASMARFQACLPKFEDGMPRLQAAINGVLYDKGLEHLCRLHRSIVLRNRAKQDPEFGAAADELARILKNDFGLEIIDPQPGDQFDAAREERVEANMSPGKVKHCVAGGWMLREQAILRAIVETLYYDLEGGEF